jgi:hypothetical protein
VVIGRHTCPKPHPDVRLKRLGRTGILLNVRTGDFFELDEPALAIWQRLDGKTEPARVARQLAAACGVPIATVERDVKQFITTLRRRDLLDGPD